MLKINNTGSPQILGDHHGETMVTIISILMMKTLSNIMQLQFDIFNDNIIYKYQSCNSYMKILFTSFRTSYFKL
jgi:hypothetical protein